MIKLPPSDEVAENAMIGSLLIDNSVLNDFFEQWHLEWFHNSTASTVAKSIFSLALEGKDVDIVSVKNSLEENGKLESVGWMTWLVELTENCISYNWRTYSDIIQNLYKKRELIKEWQKFLNSCYWTDNMETAVEESFTKINWLLSEWASSATDMEANISLLQTYIENNTTKSLVWYSWWNEWLDSQTQWIRKGKTYRIGAPSGVGKTNLIYGTIKNLLEQGAKVLFISLENDIETTYVKFLSSVQNVNNIEIEKGNVKPDIEWLRKYKDKFILTDQLFELGDIKREVMRVKPDVVILDYIGLITIDWVRDDDKIYTPYSKQIKTFVQKNKHIAWIDLSNLNTSETEDEIRKFGKFNGSAALKNNTDFWLHMFHYKPYYEYREFAMEKGEKEAYEKFKNFKVVTFYISKNRLWPDLAEKEYGINFNEWINYLPISEEKKALWKSF